MKAGGLLLVVLGWASAFTGPHTWSGGARQQVRSLQMSAGGSLAWDDNAAWLEACKSSGVASWYDSGLRLTEGVEPETRAVGVIVAETAAWVREGTEGGGGGAWERVAAAAAGAAERISALTAEGAERVAARASMLEKYTKVSGEQRIAALTAEGAERVVARAATLEQYTKITAEQHIAALTAEGKRVIADRATKTAA